MNYKEIVDSIKQLVQKHYFINEFGYGDISDIKSKSQLNDNESADYPYLFLNPSQHSRVNNLITYRFNMIIMDMVADDDYLKVQSDCQLYADDIISRFNDKYKVHQINITNVQYTTFKERFQDTVAGMTVSIEIILSKPIDKCTLPYEEED